MHAVPPVSEPPGNPKKLTVIDTTSHSISLSWQPPKSDGGSSILKYSIAIACGNDSEFVPLFDVEDTSCVVDNLNAGTGYQFAVCALNKEGSGKSVKTNKPVFTKMTLSKFITWA